MSKRMMVFVMAVVSAALFALPAGAAAQSWHIDQTTSFSVTGSGGTLTSTEGSSLTCTSTTGTGTFSTTTGGNISMTFHGCTGPFGFACTSAGQSSGTITTTSSFDGIMVSSGKPGILLTPTGSTEPTPGQKLYKEFSCLGISIKIFGKGAIGTLSTSFCSAASTTATLTFTSTAQPGHQEDKTWTGTTYDLQSNITASHPTFSTDGTTTLTFPAARKATCK